MFTTRSISPKAPATDRPGAADSLVLCVHGSRATAGSLARRARALASQGYFSAAAGCALRGEPDLERTLAGMPGDRVLIVPFLMADGYSYDLLRGRLAELEGARPLVLCAPIGTHPDMAQGILASARGRAASLGWCRDDCALLLVGHGTRRHRASRTALETLSRRAAAADQFAQTGFALLEEEPSIEQALEQLNTRRVIVVGVFAEAGRHGADDVPDRLTASGRETSYLGPLGCEPWIDDIILARARDGARAAML